MAVHNVYANAKAIEVCAVVLRADGRVEDLGTISYWHKNPLRRIWWRIKQVFKG